MTHNQPTHADGNSGNRASHGKHNSLNSSEIRMQRLHIALDAFTFGASIKQDCVLFRPNLGGQQQTQTVCPAAAIHDVSRIFQEMRIMNAD